MTTKATIAVGLLLVTLELAASGHHVHVPEFAFSIDQHGWSQLADAARWTCSAVMKLG